MLLEKLKADDDRINIKKMNSDDNDLPSLSGGYIVKADKIEGEEILAWEMPSSSGWVTSYALENPKSDEISDSQKNYIQNIFERLEKTAQQGDISIIDGYPSVIDLPSFIDFMIINEYASNVDAYQFSTFFHKDRNLSLIHI